MSLAREGVEVTIVARGREAEPAAGPAEPHAGVEDPALSVDAGTLLLTLAVLGAALSLVLQLTGSSELSLAARLVVAAVAFTRRLGVRAVAE